MKELIILTLFLYLGIKSFSQHPVQKQDLAAKDYYKKSSQQKTAAWILTGAGTAGLLVTAAVDGSQATSGALTSLFSLGTVEPAYKSYTVLYLLSAALAAGGTYLFFASAKNKKKAKAASVFINMEKTPVLQHSIIRNRSFAVAGVRIGL
jgi:hypothetical protein